MNWVHLESCSPLFLLELSGFHSSGTTDTILLTYGPYIRYPLTLGAELIRNRYTQEDSVYAYTFLLLSVDCWLVAFKQTAKQKQNRRRIACNWLRERPFNPIQWTNETAFIIFFFKNDGNKQLVALTIK